MAIRPLEQQFQPERIEEIRALQKRFELLQITFRPSKTFVFEIVRALEAGLFLSPLLAAAALLELLVRETVIDRLSAAAGRGRPNRAEISHQIEESRSLGFDALVSRLSEFEILEPEDCDRMKSSYSRIRIPLHHAIVGRYIRDRQEPWLADLYRGTPLEIVNQGKQFEETIEDFALDDLRSLLDSIESVVRLGAV
jgi:hypothetical protein